MKWLDIKNMSIEELKEVLTSSKADLVDLRFKAHSGALKQVHKIKSARKDIARILTKMNSFKNDSKN
jgi:ribosomal protein L29